MQHSPFNYQRQPLNLKPYIKLVQEKGVVYGIDFYLNQERIKAIQQAKQQDRPGQLPAQLRTNFRYHTLFGTRFNLELGLTFCTYYQEEGNSQALVKSVISLDGDIIQQIATDCLHSSSFALGITTAHYWLIEQLFQEMRQQLKHRFNKLSWLLSAGVTGTFVGVNWQQLLQMHPSSFAIPVVMAWLFQQGFKRLLRRLLPLLGRWCWRQLVLGVIPRSSSLRRIILLIVARLGW